MLSSVLKVRKYRILLPLIGLAAVLTIIGVSVTPTRAGTLRRGGWYDQSSGGGPEGGVLPAVNGIPALTGIDYDFKSDDHHIKEVTASFDGNITNRLLDRWYENYADWNQDDDYTYSIGWQELPAGTTFGRGCIKTGTGRKVLFSLLNLGSARSQTTPVLTGFRMSNASGDMHLRHVALKLLEPGDSDYNPAYVQAYVKFADGFSLYSYTGSQSLCVSYAAVPTSHVRQMPGISGTAPNCAARGVLSAQYPVLTGFDMKFKEISDHHIDRLAAMVEPGEWSVAFGDWDCMDDFEYVLWPLDIIP